MVRPLRVGAIRQVLCEIRRPSTHGCSPRPAHAIVVDVEPFDPAESDRRSIRYLEQQMRHRPLSRLERELLNAAQARLTGKRQATHVHPAARLFRGAVDLVLVTLGRR